MICYLPIQILDPILPNKMKKKKKKHFSVYNEVWRAYQNKFRLDSLYYPYWRKYCDVIMTPMSGFFYFVIFLYCIFTIVPISNHYHFSFSWVATNVVYIGSSNSPINTWFCDKKFRAQHIQASTYLQVKVSQLKSATLTVR